MASKPHQPFISVIVPFLNGVEWLIEALQSVINQSFTNWELILVDDGSLPENREIAKGFCLQYPGKLKFTHHEGFVNKGVTISRRHGISLSRGAYLAFLDSDDKWMPDKLKNQIDLFNQFHAAQMICEASIFWYSWKDAAAADNVVPVGAAPGKLYYPSDLIKNLYPLGEGASPCPSGIMVSREAYDRSGGFEPSFSGTFQLYEDQAFLSKIYLNEIIYISGQANNFYRKRPGSMSSFANDKEHYEKVRRFYLDWLEEYMRGRHIEDREIALLISLARKQME